MKRKDELDDVARMPNGARKKFILLTEFREELAAATALDPAKLGCCTLVALLGGDSRLGPQCEPSPDPEAAE